MGSNCSGNIKPENERWFVVGYGFTSINYIYVDFEDGHSVYRSLLKCDIENNNVTLCKSLALFEKRKNWELIQGEDTQVNNSIVYSWAKDYDWKR